MRHEVCIVLRSKMTSRFNSIDMSEEITCFREGYAKNIGTTLIDNSKLLIQAIKQGNEAVVIKLLVAGVPPYVTDQFGNTCFFYAARYNYINILKLLLKAGALVNVPTKMGRTGLQIAAYHGHTDGVAFLLGNKANIDQVDNLKMSALHWACENNHFDTVKLLLKAGANTNLVNKFGKTASDIAFKKGNYEIYDLLRGHIDNADDNTELLLNEKLLDATDEKYHSFSAVFIPDRGQLLQSKSKSDVEQSNLAFKDISKKNDTIQLFEQHGIKLLPVDQSTIIASALKRGQTAVLTEAGKLALKKTEPNIRRIANMSNKALISEPPAKKQKPDDENNDTMPKNTISVASPLPKVDRVDIPLNKAKIIKIDAKQLVNLTANKKLIISKPKQLNPSPVTNGVLQVENLKPNSTLIKNTNQSNSAVNMLRDVKRQLDLSLQLAKHYKTQYERKEREAALYKIQLANLSRIVINSGIKIDS